MPAAETTSYPPGSRSWQSLAANVEKVQHGIFAQTPVKPPAALTEIGAAVHQRPDVRGAACSALSRSLNVFTQNCAHEIKEFPVKE